MRIVGLDQDRRRVELEDAGLSECPGMAATWICRLRQKHFSAKNKEEGRSARAWPVAAPMPKSDSFWEKKKECLVLAFSFCVPFTVGVAMYL